MRGAREHGDIVLAAVVAGRGSARALDYISTHLLPAHFPDKRQSDLLVILLGYNLQTHGIVSRDALEDLLRDKPAGSRLDLLTYYDVLAARPLPTGAEFKHSVAQMAQLAASADTGVTLAAGLEILKHEVWVDDGKTCLHGHEDAREHVLAELARIDRDLHLTESPEGDAHDEADDILAGYARAKALRLDGHVPGVRTGIAGLDGYLEGGTSPGEMAVILGWTTSGKSRMCVQWAWDASVVQGKNVIYFTTETLRPQICINLVARHSRLPRFGLAEGLNARKIRAGALSLSEEAALRDVIKDFRDGSYGRLRVVQMPEHCTVPGMAARYAAIERQFVPDFVIADYLQLFEPERRSREDKENVSQAGILKAAERWCGSCSGGRGVAFVTPWQINRAGRQGMRASGGYTLEDSAGTAEASNTPDIVLALIDREEDTSGGRRAPLEVSVLKNRDGPRGKRFPIEGDYATCHFADRDQPDDAELELGEMASV